MNQPAQLWMHKKHQRRAPFPLEMVDARTAQRHINKYTLKNKYVLNQNGREVQTGCRSRQGRIPRNASPEKLFSPVVHITFFGVHKS